MAKGRPKGQQKVGGRVKGTLNKATLVLESVSATLRRMGHNPTEATALTAMGRVPCGTCIDSQMKPTGRTRYKLADGKHANDCGIFGKDAKKPLACSCEGIGSRVCESCYGTLWERISVETKLAANRELMKYEHPQLRAIEVSNPDGSLRPSWVVVRPGEAA